MTMHYGKTLKELTVDDIWFGARMNLGASDGRTFIPGAYGTFSEADSYAYDAWCYFDYLKRGGTNSPEGWTAKIPDIEKREMYLNLLNGAVEIYKANLRRLEKIGKDAPWSLIFSVTHPI